MSDTATALKAAMETHFNPPAELVFKKGNADYVGHADITRILTDIDPLWTWEPAAMGPDGPVIVERHGRLCLWGWMTVLGKRLPCVGTVETRTIEKRLNSPQGPVEVDKELIGDLIRNGAMRFGIALGLWSKADWAEPGLLDSRTPDEHRTADTQPVSTWDEARWKALADRLRGLPEAGRNVVVARLTELGLFVERKPVTPFADADLDKIEKLIGLGSFDDRPAHQPEHAVKVMANALACNDPLNPPDGVTIEPWMWDLAAVEDLDAHDWKTTAKAAQMRQKDLLEEAAKAAEALEVEAPARLDEIHGDLAVELRVQLIRSGEPF